MPKRRFNQPLELAKLQMKASRSWAVFAVTASVAFSVAVSTLVVTYSTPNPRQFVDLPWLFVCGLFILGVSLIYLWSIKRELKKDVEKIRQRKPIEL
jgi:hypothetical protein